jgi:hypothetical protein
LLGGGGWSVGTPQNLGHPKDFWPYLSVA